ncbi:MAG: alpha/beta hydrolase [Acidobacteria bacterium]|nr:alpha/beta hydrolase [Acidobacteriota bacterium]
MPARPALVNILFYLAIAAGVYAFLYWHAQKSVYFPSRYPQGYWDMQARIGARDAELRSQDGVRLHAWWIPKDGAPFATLHLHGNGGNITHRAALAPEIGAAGSSLLLLDYRGYGKSEGKPGERGLYADADAGYDWLIARGFSPERIIVHGESLGTAVAVDLAARRPCAGLILEAPFTSAKEVAGRVLPVLGPLLIWSYDSFSKIGRVRAPILVMHGDRDTVIAHALGKKLYDAAPEPKVFWTIPGAGHNDLLPVAGPEYRDRLRRFYAAIAGDARL